jgi:hypothetical protein
MATRVKFGCSSWYSLWGLHASSSNATAFLVLVRS